MKAAERTLRDIIARDPLDANALNSLGYMYAERGERLDEAVSLLQRALEGRARQPLVPRQPRLGLLPAGQARSRGRAAHRSCRQAGGELGRAGSPRRPAIQAAALRRGGGGVEARARRRRSVNRSRQGREEAARGAGTAVIAAAAQHADCRWSWQSSRPGARRGSRRCRPGPAADFPGHAAAYAEATGAVSRPADDARRPAYLRSGRGRSDSAPASTPASRHRGSSASSCRRPANQFSSSWPPTIARRFSCPATSACSLTRRRRRRWRRWPASRSRRRNCARSSAAAASASAPPAAGAPTATDVSRSMSATPSLISSSAPAAPWQLVAAVRGPIDVRYADHVAGRPATVRVRTGGGTRQGDRPDRAPVPGRRQRNAGRRRVPSRHSRRHDADDARRAATGWTAWPLIASRSRAGAAAPPARRTSASAPTPRSTSICACSAREPTAITSSGPSSSRLRSTTRWSSRRARARSS